ncbi:MAG: hypothetical protein JL50_11210 [Peptococcaceae bacterium BICA1-7]|nr:MAG: hypothetical protein JL50_11210 [Peptococcaceae bacterium BICA1-7]
MAKAKVNRKSIINSSSQTEKTILWHVAFWSLAVLLFLPPFFRGLFFATEQRKAFLFALIIFGLVCLWKWLRKDYSVLSHPMDYLMLALPIVYGASTISAVNYGLAVDEIVKTILYFIVYWAVAQLIRDRNDIERLISVIYASGALVALGGLLVSTKIISIKDGLQGDRFASFLQYPNSLAGYLIAILLLGIYLWWKQVHIGDGTEKIKRFYAYIFVIGNYLLATVIVGTKSSGGYIVLTLVLFMVMLLLPEWNRMYVFSQLIITIVLAIPTAHLFLKYVPEQQYAKAWSVVFVGILLAVLAQYLYDKIIPRLNWLKSNTVPGKRLAAASVIIVVTIISIGYIFLSKAGVGLEIVKISSFMDRVYFIQDAVRMIMERPLLGWGGGGWADAYPLFQSYSYSSRQVHSYFAQVAVETGIIGLAAIIGAWTAFLFTCFRALKKHENITGRMLVLLLAIAVVALGMHASVDFDLSLSAISIILYANMALIRNMDILEERRISEAKKNGLTKIPIVIAMCLGLIIMALLFVLFKADAYFNDSDRLLRQKMLNESIVAMEKTVMYTPFRVEYHTRLADLYMYGGQKEKAFSELHYALEWGKYDYKNYVNLSAAYLQQGNYEKAIYYASEAIKMAPLTTYCYEFTGSVYISAGVDALKKNDTEKGKQYFYEATKMPDRIDFLKANMDEHKRFMSVYSGFDMSAVLALNSGIANSLLGERKIAMEQLNIATWLPASNNTKAQALVWLSLLCEKAGDQQNAEGFLNSAKEVSEDYLKIYNNNKDLLIFLQEE